MCLSMLQFNSIRMLLCGLCIKETKKLTVIIMLGHKNLLSNNILSFCGSVLVKLEYLLIESR